MRMRWSVVVALVAVGCASNRAAEVAPPPETKPGPAGTAEAPKVDVDAALRRERSPLPLQAVPFPDGAFTAQIEASAAPQVTAHEGVFEVNVPLEKNARMRCFVYPEYVDPGAAMVRIVSGAADSVELQQFRPTKIVAEGIDPLVFAEAAYVTDKNLGLLKLGGFATDDASFLCVHDEVGYRATFERIVRGFAQSLQPPERTRDPEFGELQVIRLGGHDVGYERQRVFVMPDGRRADDMASLLLMPRSATELSHQASYKITESDAQGRVETMRFFETEDGAPRVEVEAGRIGKEKNEYGYRGTREGEAVEGTFRSKEKEGLPGDCALEAQFSATFFQKPGAALAIEQYDPELDPARTIEIPVKAMDAQSRTAELTLSGQKATTRFDQSGRMEHLEMDLGGATLTQERIAQVGALK